MRIDQTGHAARSTSARTLASRRSSSEVRTDRKKDVVGKTRFVPHRFVRLATQGCIIMLFFTARKRQKFDGTLATAASV
jgi:hypothetical protein